MIKYVLEKPYVYVVLEHANPIYDEKLDLYVEVKHCILHGIYTDRFMACNKKSKLEKDLDFSRLSVGRGYISILKKPIQGHIKERHIFGCLSIQQRPKRRKPFTVDNWGPL